MHANTVHLYSILRKIDQRPGTEPWNSVCCGRALLDDVIGPS
jgi:hypothetical protein